MNDLVVDSKAKNLTFKPSSHFFTTGDGNCVGCKKDKKEEHQKDKKEEAENPQHD